MQQSKRFTVSHILAVVLGVVALLSSAVGQDATNLVLRPSRLTAILAKNPNLLDAEKRKYEDLSSTRAKRTGETSQPLSDDQFLAIVRTDESVQQWITDDLIDAGLVDVSDPEISVASDSPGTSLRERLDQDDSVGYRRGRTRTGEYGSVDQHQSLSDRASLDPTLVDDEFDSSTSAQSVDGLSMHDIGSLRQGSVAGNRPRAQYGPRLPKNEHAAAPLAGDSMVRRKANPYLDIPSLRDMYAQSFDTNAPVERFGASLFSMETGSAVANQADLPGSADYVLGPGDGLTLDILGPIARRVRLVIDGEGRVGLPEVGTLMLARHTLEEARDIVQRALETQFKNVRANLNLSRVRKVRVYVVGEVARPGAYDVSGLSTVLNALTLAGGPTSRGSMRHVKHMRGTKLMREADLYELLISGIRSDVAQLQSGDTILVPPLGPQVAIVGAVRRPAMYEVTAGTSLKDLLDLAGGSLVSASLERIRVERIQAHQARITVDVHVPSGQGPHAIQNALASFSLQDGDRVGVPAIPAYANRTVYVTGHVQRPGKYPFRDGMTLADVIGGYGDLLPEPSSHAEVVRLAPPDFHPVSIQFNLSEVLQGREKLELKASDTIRIFGRYEVDAPKVSIFGEVLRPGQYPMTEGMSAADLVRTAGGFKRSAYVISADLSSYEVSQGLAVETEHREVPIGRALNGEPDTDVRLRPGDVLSIRMLSGWQNIGSSVSISGEVGHPGTYGIQDGEKLSSVLQRAGGFRPDAYAEGAVLIREQVKQLDQAARDQLIRRIQSTTPEAKSASNAGEAATLAAAFAQQQQQILRRLQDQKPVGRQVIHISTSIAKWQNSSSDIELRAGDQIIIPKKPNFVLINGQVNSPSALSYVPGKNAAWYLEKAGGVTDFGNSKAIFIVRADGSVVGNNKGKMWGGGVLSTAMRPGDTLVIPERILSDSMVWKNILNTAQVMSSIAITSGVVASF